MRCRFVREIYHNKDNGFCIFVYHTEDADVPEAAKDARYKGKGAWFTVNIIPLGSHQFPASEPPGNFFLESHLRHKI